MTFFSGGARGADTYWEIELIKLGHNVIVYRPEDYDTSDKQLEIELYYQKVVKTLNRKILPTSIYAGKLVRRDMLQVQDASQVIAIASIGKDGYVNGGTGYATTRAILMGLPVYVYDQTLCKWFVWNKKFVKCERPHLVDKTCCVGSREINSEGYTELLNVVNDFALKKCPYKIYGHFLFLIYTIIKLK